MRDQTKNPTDKTPGKYRSVDDGTYRGYDPNDPWRFRDKKNHKGPKQTIADGVDFDHSIHDVGGEDAK